MDLYAFEQKTTGAASVGELVFADNHWQLVVEIPNDGTYMVNLTGEFDSPLTEIYRDSKDICIGLSSSFNWIPQGEIKVGNQEAPRHLSIVITDAGPVICVFVGDRYMFFSTAGKKCNAPRGGAPVLNNWLIHVRDARDSRSWQLIKIGPPAAKS